MLDQEISLPVIVLTAHGDVQATRLAMKNGAFDFLETVHHDCPQGGERARPTTERTWTEQ